MKWIIILLLIIVGFVVLTNYVLGAIRRFLGIQPQKKSFPWSSGFKSQRKSPAQSQDADEQILYHKDDVVVLSGESRQEEKQRRNNLRDASFSDKD